MDTQDFNDMFTKDLQAFNSAKTLKGFIRHACIKPKFKEHLRKYCDGWAERYFQTCKSHGLARAPHSPLAMPHAKTVADVFSACALLPNGSKKGTFISGHRGGGFAFSGHIGGKYSHTYRAGDPEPHLRLSGTTFEVTRVTLTDKAKNALSSTMTFYDWTWGLEAVRWEDGRTLLVARYDQIIGGTWLAVLDAGETLEGLYSEKDAARIHASRTAQPEYLASIQA